MFLLQYYNKGEQKKKHLKISEQKTIPKKEQFILKCIRERKKIVRHKKLFG